MTFKLFIVVLTISAFIEKGATSSYKKISGRTSYYLSIEGNDANDGSINHPLKSLIALNTLDLKGGDSVLLKGGETFNGNIHLAISHSSLSNFLLTSYGRNEAVINADNGIAIEVNQSSGVTINNIICKGSGRKNGNTKPGVLINNSASTRIAKVDISGFQKSGLQLYNCTNTVVENINAHNNGYAGISIEGDFNNKRGTKNIVIKNCSAVNNPGDPTNFTNHSGNGIIVGHCTNVLIDHCMAANNGWDMPRIGNGPVGIWCYEADSVIIQHCISCKNKTSKGGEDGGGYDFDGGTSNSTIQYCLSYQNQGSAFGIFQYAGASLWHDNTIRFCISLNDGKVSAAHANAYIWNSSHDALQFKNLLFYNNTIYNINDAAINYSVESEHVNFKFYNNLFIGAGEIIKGNYKGDVFFANDWYSLKDTFNADNTNDFKAWITKYNIEQLNGKTVGLNILPLFKNINGTTFTNVNNITGFESCKIIGASPVILAGIDLHALFNIDVGDKDFNDEIVNKKCLGACTNK